MKEDFIIMDYLKNSWVALKANVGGKPNQIQKNIIYQIGTILNISWLIEAAENPVDIICQRSTNCPRLNNCENFPKSRKKISWTNQIKEEILKTK